MEIEIKQHVKQFPIEQTSKLHAIINSVFLETEKELWGDDYERIPLRKLEAMIKRGDVHLVLMDGIVIGCVNINEIEKGLFSFGMMAIEKARQGLGIGRRILEYVENYALVNGGIKLQLELLSPVGFILDSKEYLKNWYVNAGFKELEIKSFQDFYPTIAKGLKHDCNFIIYQKELTTRSFPL